MRLLKRPVFVSMLLFVVYAVLMVVYFRYTVPIRVPPEYAGTPVDPNTYLTPGQIRGIETHRAWYYPFRFIQLAWPWFILWLLVAGGAASRMRALLERMRLPRFLLFLVYVMLVVIVYHLAHMFFAFGWYLAQYVSGIGTYHPLRWLLGYLNAAVPVLAEDYVSFLIPTGIAWWFMARGGRWKWKMAFVLVPFLFIYNIVYLEYDRYTTPVRPLPDKQLEQKILDFADRAGIQLEGVYVTHKRIVADMNARMDYGIGLPTRIVMDETMLRETSEEGLLLVAAHELGHYAGRHVPILYAWDLLVDTAKILAGAWLYERFVRRWGTRFGIRRLADLSGIAMFLSLFLFLNFALKPVDAAVVRHTEREADRYLVELYPYPELAIEFVQKMVVVRGDHPHPPLLERLLRIHPTDMERLILAYEKLKEQGK